MLSEIALPFYQDCRDRLNFEDRRDIDHVALRALHSGPSVSCQEFKPRNRNVDLNKSNDRFCVNRANFEEVEGICICAKEHMSRIACGGFNSRIEMAEATV
jgi:hypothetical protein